MKRTDDKGFSLVELLIAVCILAIVVAPMLNSIVSAFHINAKSRNSLRATTLAQNEMEIFEKETIADLIDADKYGYEATTRPDGYQVAPGSPAADGSYMLFRQGVVNSTGSEYDIYITLDPERESGGGSTEKYHGKNMAELLTMNTINNRDSGMYVQQVSSADSSIDQDALAYQYFRGNLLPGTVESQWPVSRFEKDLHRTITVDIEHNESSGITNVKVTYDYELITIDPIVDPATYKVESIIFDNTGTLDEEGNPIALKCVYLFYAPRYKAVSGINGDKDREKIVINNKDGLPVDIYIVRQELEDSTGSTIVMPNDYEASVTISDKLNSEDRTAGTYHTNLNFKGSGAAGNEIDFDLCHEDGRPTGFLSDGDVRAMGLVPLDAKATKDRIYSMKVEVYEAGANIATDSPITTLTGTKLE